MNRTTRLAALALFVCGVARAQPMDRDSEANGRAWYMYFGDHPLGGGPWGFHFDGQFRMEGAGERLNQLLLRPGLNFDVNESVQLSGGYAFIHTAGPKDAPPGFGTPENRLWQQLILKQRIGSVRLAHRYRLEQRFIGRIRANESGEGERDGTNYQNRLRYFLKGTMPFGDDSRYYGAFYNEVMVAFGDNVQNNIFDQNRAYGAIGIRLNETSNIEIGYLLQIVQRPSGSLIQYNHTFQLGFFSSRPLR